MAATQTGEGIKLVLNIVLPQSLQTLLAMMVPTVPPTMPTATGGLTIPPTTSVDVDTPQPAAEKKTDALSSSSLSSSPPLAATGGVGRRKRKVIDDTVGNGQTEEEEKKKQRKVFVDIVDTVDGDKKEDKKEEESKDADPEDEINMLIIKLPKVRDLISTLTDEMGRVDCEKSKQSLSSTIKYYQSAVVNMEEQLTELQRESAVTNTDSKYAKYDSGSGSSSSCKHCNRVLVQSGLSLVSRVPSFHCPERNCQGAAAVSVIPPPITSLETKEEKKKLIGGDEDEVKLLPTPPAALPTKPTKPSTKSSSSASSSSSLIGGDEVKLLPTPPSALPTKPTKPSSSASSSSSSVPSNNNSITQPPICPLTLTVHTSAKQGISFCSHCKHALVKYALVKSDLAITRCINSYCQEAKAIITHTQAAKLDKNKGFCKLSNPTAKLERKYGFCDYCKWPLMKHGLGARCGDVYCQELCRKDTKHPSQVLDVTNVAQSIRDRYEPGDRIALKCKRFTVTILGMNDKTMRVAFDKKVNVKSHIGPGRKDFYTAKGVGKRIYEEDTSTSSRVWTLEYSAFA